MKMIFQRSEGHEFVDQKPLISIGTVANQIDEIRMVK